MFLPNNWNKWKRGIPGEGQFMIAWVKLHLTAIDELCKKVSYFKIDFMSIYVPAVNYIII